MHPPFHAFVDHRIDRHDILPTEERRVIRRARPEPLRFDLPAPGQARLFVATRAPPVAIAPGRLRRWIGARLIALGRRLADPVAAE